MPTSPLSRLDAFVLLVAIVSVFATFQGGSGVLLKPSWSFAFDHDEPHPPPVVADLDSDGVAEVVVATADGRVMVLSPASARMAAATADQHAGASSAWRSLPVRHTASLRSSTGLTTGRRPLAIAAGAVSPSGSIGGGKRQHIVVALTEDWTVLAFDSRLRLLWEHSLGSEGQERHGKGRKVHDASGDASHDAALDAALRREVALLVSPQPIYTGDAGLVLIGGQREERTGNGDHDAGQGGAEDARFGAADARFGGAPSPSAPGQPGSSAEASGAAARRSHGHFDYYALEAATGVLRWRHGQSDFHRALHGDKKLTPQMDYILDLDALGGGGEAGIDGRHEGERPWRVFKDSILRLLPHAWRHPHDTSLTLARFVRAKRQPEPSGSGRPAGSATAHASAASVLELASSSLSALRTGGGAGGNAARSSGAGSGGGGGGEGGEGGEGGGESNVVVAKRRHGLEVLHLYTGRPLTQIELPAFASHADVNGDGAVDHVSALSSEATIKALEAAAGEGGEGGGAAGGDEEAQEEALAEDAAKRRRKGRKRERRERTQKRRQKSRAHRRGHATATGGRPNCLGRCSSGVPVREELWNASVCTLAPAVRQGRLAGQRRLHGLAAPLLVARDAALAGGPPTMDAAFLASDGKVTCIDAEGEERWQTGTDASWRITAPGAEPADGAFLPSLTVFMPTPGAEPLLLALGERSACMLSHADGKLLSCVRLPHAPIGPPVLGDFSADGVTDVIVPAAHAHLGLRAAAGAGSLMSKLLFCFLGLAIVLAVLLRYGELV